MIDDSLFHEGFGKCPTCHNSYVNFATHVCDTRWVCAIDFDVDYSSKDIYAMTCQEAALRYVREWDKDHSMAHRESYVVILVTHPGTQRTYAVGVSGSVEPRYGVISKELVVDPEKQIPPELFESIDK